MEPNVAEERVESDSPKAEEESKNEQTVISGDEGNFQSCKNPVTVAADNRAEVASIISPAKTIEPPQETKNLKNDKKKKEVQVSNTKKPFIFYLNRAKLFLLLGAQSSEFCLAFALLQSALDNMAHCSSLESLLTLVVILPPAIPTVVTIAEILKRNGFAIQKGIMTSTVLSTQEDRKGRRVEKAKIEIVLGRADAIDESC
ncbi:hypothetical protein V6N12_027948 [Hibiscus sabdariffa]|uniref:Uncharacterized protein n=1 Tax=Hibiscus sabdariffa TaxID=183260 RepID=A0ABR2F4D5_9ROSI